MLDFGVSKTTNTKLPKARGFFGSVMVAICLSGTHRRQVAGTLPPGVREAPPGTQKVPLGPVLLLLLWTDTLKGYQKGSQNEATVIVFVCSFTDYCTGYKETHQELVATINWHVYVASLTTT